MTELLRPQDLHKIAEDLDMQRAKKAFDRQKREEEERAGLRDVFMSREIHPEAKMRVNNAIRRAAEQGNRQLMVVTFPATYCNDAGRRINNLEKDWPQSLEGFAKLAYEYYVAELQSLGFKLTAQVIDYPGGMPGNIGLYLSWDS
jgi:hypothetical protein